MTGLLRAEALKLRSTRSFSAITIGALALIAVAVTAIAAADTFEAGDHPARDTLAVAGNAQCSRFCSGCSRSRASSATARSRRRS